MARAASSALRHPSTASLAVLREVTLRSATTACRSPPTPTVVVAAVVEVEEEDILILAKVCAITRITKTAPVVAAQEEDITLHATTTTTPKASAVRRWGTAPEGTDRGTAKAITAKEATAVTSHPAAALAVVVADKVNNLTVDKVEVVADITVQVRVMEVAAVTTIAITTRCTRR